MNTTLHRQSLLEALTLATGSVVRANQTPILNAVLLTADTASQSLVITTTNLQIRLTTSLPAKVTANGSYALPATKLLAIIRSMTAETVRIAEGKSAGVLQISSGVTVFNICSTEGKEFPTELVVNETSKITASQKDLLSLFRHVAECQSEDPQRHILNATHLHVDVRAAKAILTAVATDSKMLARMTLEVEFSGQLAPDSSISDIIIPAQTVHEIIRMGKSALPDHPATLEYGRNGLNLRIRTEGPENTTRDVTISSVLFQGTYPANTHHFLANRPALHASVSVDDLLRSLACVSLVCTERTMGVQMAFTEDMVRLKAETAELGTSSDAVALAKPGPAESSKFRVNPKQLTRLLESWKGHVANFHFPSTNRDPIHISMVDEPSFRSLVMPVVVEVTPQKSPIKEPAPAAVA